jgi:hypothetical protein
MSAARIWLLILCALVVQQLLPAITVTGGDAASTGVAWEQVPALAGPHQTSLTLR